MLDSIDLPAVFAFIVAFAIFAYVVMDGFDLGLGILSPLLPERQDRDTMMNTVAPVWDGNETWLILGGGGLFAAFPLAYAILIPAIYTPVIVMLLGLIFRGVAFEFRFRADEHRYLWDIGFFAGSLLAALSQGIALGAILQGVTVSGRSYGGGWWDWLTPFTLLTGASVVVGYALLGATWLVMRTEGALQDRAFTLARVLVIGTLAALATVSLATPFLEADYWRRWFAWPNILMTAPIPLAVAAVAFFLLRALANRRDFQPFLWSLALFLLSFVGLGVSIWPYVVPNQVTVWQAAAPAASLGFLLVGLAVLLPIILAYTAYAYWIFRGKVARDAGYH
jgi:cytochrome bd ubiquinol oxidase subunit II